MLVHAFPAQAQYSSETDNRLRRMENEIETLSRALYKGEDPPPPSTFSNSSASVSADTEVRLQQLESQIRDLNGKLEEQSYQIRQMQEQLERSLSDIEMRLGSSAPNSGASSYDNAAGSTGYTDTVPPQPGGYTNGAGAQTYQDATVSKPSSGGGDDFQWSSSGQAPQDGQLGTLTTSGASGATSSADAAAAQYENAFALLKNGQYDTAESEFNSFIGANPDHVLISNAKYWLGETYYARGKFEDAARVFAEGYQQYPKASKAADNLLKLSLSLAGMGNKDDACVALAQLEKDFSTGSAPVLRRAAQEKSRLGCS